MKDEDWKHRAPTKRAPEQYTLTSEPNEQLTPMGDDWYVVYHTSIPNDHWWAVRHQCPNGQVRGMAWHPGKTTCTGCKVVLPSEIEGFIIMMEWTP